jgi:hypothetical protein
MTHLFTHELACGEIVSVVYEFVDEDDSVGLPREFEYSVYNEFKKDIRDDLNQKELAEIETEIAYRFQRWVDDQRKEADIARWESQLD